VSALRHVTVSPTVTVVDAGVKPAVVIWTVLVSAPADAATTSVASSATGSSSKRLMRNDPPLPADLYFGSSRNKRLSSLKRFGIYRFLTIVWVPLWLASRPLPAWLIVRKTRMCDVPR